MNRYFKTADTKNFVFYKVPKALFEEKYKSVSTDAKMLYGLLLDRMYLSVKNGWMTDKNKSIYAPYFEKNDEPFFMKIGNTTYEVSTHFNPNGRENVLQQFQKLILPEKPI